MPEDTFNDKVILVQSGNNPWPEPMLTRTYVAGWRHEAKLVDWWVWDNRARRVTWWKMSIDLPWNHTERYTTIFYFTHWIFHSILFVSNKIITKYGHYATSLKCSWWRYQMETLPALLVLCAGKPPVDSPRKGQRRGALIFFNLRLSKRLSKHSRRQWLKSYRAHYDVIVMLRWVV